MKTEPYCCIARENHVEVMIHCGRLGFCQGKVTVDRGDLVVYSLEVIFAILLRLLGFELHGDHRDVCWSELSAWRNT